MDSNIATNRKLVIPRAPLTTLATKHKDSEGPQIDVIDCSGPRAPTTHPVPISDQDYTVHWILTSKGLRKEACY